MKNRIIVVIIVLVIVFLAGFIPQYIKVKRLENDLSVTRQENAWRNSAIWQASRKNYGLTDGTCKEFFSRTREVANRAPDANAAKL